jgi:hypothetical protein
MGHLGMINCDFDCKLITVDHSQMVHVYWVYHGVYHGDSALSRLISLTIGFMVDILVGDKPTVNHGGSDHLDHTSL